ncbi:Fungal-trans domain-containing protein [Fusarium sp. LHS14.1]|nr:Fungal-trans domain-containing protein [Fusarium sp. LHS14.1]
MPPQVERDPQRLSEDTAGSFIDRYFKEVHPVYPIFDRQWFDRMCLTYNPGHAYCPNKPWAAIYWTVLALGCMHAGEGSFTPGQGLSWELFSKALALYASVILSKKVLISTQALRIMAVYSMSVEGFRYETLFITEAARAAVLMGKTGMQNPEDELARRRTFWIIYCLEKELSFHTTTASSNAQLICDDEVCCLLPPPERVLADGIDWIRTWAGLCRIMSRAYTSLFSPGSRARSEEQRLAEIKSVEADTKAWKQSMPDSLRPGEPLQRFHFSQPSARAIALRIHLLYHGFISSLARYTLHTCRNGPSEQLADARWSLMVAAQSTVSLTQYIPQEPFTSMM